MSVLKPISQSITPNRQPAFNSGAGSNVPPERSRCLPMALRLQGNHSLALLRPAKTTTSGGHGHGGALPHDLLTGLNPNNMLDGPVAPESPVVMRAVDAERDSISAAAATHNVESQPLTTPGLLSFLSEKGGLKLPGSRRSTLHDDLSKRYPALAVVVSSAVKLENEQIDLISRKMQRITGFTNLQLENVIDPSLLAGFVISYDSDGPQVIDLSVKGQLAALAARVDLNG